MIYIGLTGWGDHYSLYPPHVKTRDKLAEYGGHFPVVEVDTSFYAVQPVGNALKWINDTPQNFNFVVKAYQGMTGHQRTQDTPFSSQSEMFDAFKASLLPYQDSGKLAMVLFQFPPWFDCKKENVRYLRYCKQKMENIPVALEFRNHTWFNEKFYVDTLSFIKSEGWIHTIADEPQVGEKSIPLVTEISDEKWTLIRMHGRNVHGWNKPKEGNWRDVRYLYKYNQVELEEWKNRIQTLKEQTENIVILFNNNSGGDAAANAKHLQDMLGITYSGLNPKQLDLF